MMKIKDHPKPECEYFEEDNPYPRCATFDFDIEDWKEIEETTSYDGEYHITEIKAVCIHCGSIDIWYE